MKTLFVTKIFLLDSSFCKRFIRNLAFMQNFIKIVFLFSFCFGFSQQKDIAVKHFETQKTQAQHFIGRDAFGNNYTLNDNVFRKENNQEKWDYKNIALGKIEQVDLTNPLQIVLFYKVMNAVVLLDNQLNETIKINFSETNPELLPQWIGLATQNRLWLYDQASQKLGMYDYQKKTFHPISVPFETAIIHSKSDYNYFYWVDNQQNLYSSNNYGKINFLGKIPEFNQIQIISSKQILLKKDAFLNLYDIEKQTSQIVSLPEKSFDNFYYKEQILSIFTDNEIRNYKIILP